MRTFLKRTIIGATVCLGIATIFWAVYALPWIVGEISHPTGSFGAPINKYLAQMGAIALAIAAGVEALCLGWLVSQRQLRKATGISVMFIYGAIALVAILCIGLLWH